MEHSATFFYSTWCNFSMLIPVITVSFCCYTASHCNDYTTIYLTSLLLMVIAVAPIILVKQIYISMTTNGEEHLFIFLLAIFASSL